MKDIPGYENYYAATEDGRIWSYKSNKFLIPYDAKGYQKVTLSINGKLQPFTVHRLIALTYIPNPENKPTIDHINRDPQDNRVSNLRWATYEEQAKNRNNRIFTKEESIKGAITSANNNSKVIEMRDKNNHSILYKTFKNAEDAAEELVHDRTKGSYIRKCARGIKPSAYGYYWTYFDKEKSLTPEAGCDSSSKEVTNDNIVIEVHH